MNYTVPSVLWCYWLGGRKGIRPVKNWVVGCWHGCLGWGADLHIAQQMPLPLTISCSSKSRLVLPFWFYLSGTCSPGWSRTDSRREVKRLCVVCACVTWTSHIIVGLHNNFDILCFLCALYWLWSWNLFNKNDMHKTFKIKVCRCQQFVDAYLFVLIHLRAVTVKEVPNVRATIDDFFSVYGVCADTLCLLPW